MLRRYSTVHRRCRILFMASLSLSLFSAAAITIPTRSHSDNGQPGSAVISDQCRHASRPHRGGRSRLTRRPPRSLCAISSPPSPSTAAAKAFFAESEGEGEEGERAREGEGELSRAVQSGVNREYICARGAQCDAADDGEGE